MLWPRCCQPTGKRVVIHAHPSGRFRRAKDFLGSSDLPEEVGHALEFFNGEQKPTYMTFIRNTSSASVARIPGISLLAAQADTGLPLGLEIDTLASNDAVLSIAQAVERVLPQWSAPQWSAPQW